MSVYVPSFLLSHRLSCITTSCRISFLEQRCQRSLSRHASYISFHPTSSRYASSSTTPASDTVETETETLTLNNGDTLSYSISGSSSPSATPLIYFHGFPSSRYESLGLGPWATKFNVRVISPDRPGLGLSTHDPYRTLLDYPPQIAQLTKHLGLRQYRIVGGSGGGPYAVACAYALPRDELKATGIPAGMGPTKDGVADLQLASRILIQATRYTPGLVERFVDYTTGRTFRSPDINALRKAMKKLLNWLPRKEREKMERDPGTLDNVIKVLQAHFRQGSAGFVTDSRVLAQDWGFKLEDIKGKVWFWYGGQDQNTPARLGREMAAKIEGSRLKVWDKDDHFSLFINHGDEIMKDILED